MSYAFVNGWRATLAAAMSNTTTALTPSSTADLPWTLDPTAVDPLVSTLIIDCDPATGEPTANSEIVKVTDTRTTPWTVERAAEAVAGGVAEGAPVAHASGVPIAFVITAGALAASTVPPLALPPTGAAGGALAGTYPSPSLAPGIVGHTSIDRVTDPLQEGDVVMATDAVPSTPSKRSSPYRCAVGSWRSDASSRLVTNSVLAASYVSLLQFMPIWVPSTETWDQIGFWVPAGGAGTGTVTFRIGVFADTGDGKPGALVYDGGTKNVTATGNQAWTIATDHATVWQTVAGFTSSANVGQVGSGLYWLGLALQSTPTTYPTIGTVNAGSPFAGGATLATVSAGWQQSSVSGALPTTAAPSSAFPTSVLVQAAHVTSRP